MATPSDLGQSVSVASFWEERYQAGQFGWDLGRPAPPFEDLLASSERPPAGRLAIVGCGRGHEALLFARHGYHVTGFDFAPSAIDTARSAAEREGLPATFVCSDIFALPDQFRSTFDCVVEHTCFCAIDPSRRVEYVDVVRSLLRPAGELIGLFFAHGQPGGPPFTTTADEVRRLFEPHFTIERLVPAQNSVEARRGKEVFARMRRR